GHGRAAGHGRGAPDGAGGARRGHVVVQQQRPLARALVRRRHHGRAGAADGLTTPVWLASPVIDRAGYIH
uniref:Uncharacterized protein n=1 Tax=Aegilops tauschii subsp. strangulata TaxID=200361 RepID=A0A453Q7T0_AEGTS